MKKKEKLKKPINLSQNSNERMLVNKITAANFAERHVSRGRNVLGNINTINQNPGSAYHCTCYWEGQDGGCTFFNCNCGGTWYVLGHCPDTGWFMDKGTLNL